MRHFESVDKPVTLKLSPTIHRSDLPFSSKFLVLYFRLVTMPVRWPLPPFSDLFQKMPACAFLPYFYKEAIRVF
jgi:hypothetical protein